jgi:hypothetical protein
MRSHRIQIILMVLLISVSCKKKQSVTANQEPTIADLSTSIEILDIVCYPYDSTLITFQLKP